MNRIQVGRATAAALLLIAGGCVQILGLHDRGEAADAGGGIGDDGPANSVVAVAGSCGMLLHPSASCASCMDKSCCAQARGCADDPACSEASSCLAACADAACRARCAAFYTLPDTLMALRSCRVQSCASECGSTCGEFSSAVAACQACLEGSCCSAGVACAGDTSCAALNLCTSNCFAAPSCPTECDQKSPQGVTDFTAFATCSNTTCATACAPGQSWQCLSAPIIWPKPKGTGTTTFSVTFVSFTTEEPFIDAAVKACNRNDFACTNPLAQSTTDATGLVSLTVAAGPQGFDGYLDVSGGKLSGSGSPLYPAIWYPVPFVIADGWRGRTLLLSSDEAALIAAATGTTTDPTRGILALNAADCAFTPAAGVTFSVDIADAKTVSYYLVQGSPVTTATATDASGIGAFVNLPTFLPARLAVVNAFSAAAGKPMGHLSFIIRPGTLTTSSLFPPEP